MKIKWLRTHVPTRNGRQGICTSFQSNDGYNIILTDRVFRIMLGDVLVTCTPIENCIEFTPEAADGTENAKKQKATT